MIYAAAPVPLPAFDLTHPAIVIADYLEEAITTKQFDVLPKSAAWMIEEFLQQALDRDEASVDPVASAVSYELAASTLRAVDEHQPKLATDDALESFLTFLKQLETEAPRPVRRAERKITRNLKEFLEKLRLRGQSASYAQFGSCV